MAPCPVFVLHNYNEKPSITFLLCKRYMFFVATKEKTLFMGLEGYQLIMYHIILWWCVAWLLEMARYDSIEPFQWAILPIVAPHHRCATRHSQLHAITYAQALACHPQRRTGYTFISKEHKLPYVELLLSANEKLTHNYALSCIKYTKTVEEKQNEICIRRKSRYLTVLVVWEYWSSAVYEQREELGELGHRWEICGDGARSQE